MAAKALLAEQRVPRQFSAALSSAALEWLLMVLLFLHALFSYFVTKFADVFKLQVPCPLCSRLDHVFGDEKPGFYKDLICKAHKAEISSLAYCHVHWRLADVREMCEGCLLSFATEKKSNMETYRFLVHLLAADLYDKEIPAVVDGEDVVKVPLLDKDAVSGPPCTRHCSCCSMPVENKSHVRGLLWSRSIGVHNAGSGVSLSNTNGHSHLHLQDGPSKSMEKHTGNCGFDRLAHVGYSELKITSDSDSEAEVPFSDDDGGNASVRAVEYLKDAAARSLQPEAVIPSLSSSPTNILIDTASEKLIHPAPDMLTSSLRIPEKTHHQEESYDLMNLADTVAIGHGLEDLNWTQVEVKAYPPDPPIGSDVISQQITSEVSNVKLDAMETDKPASVSATTTVDMSQPLDSAEIDQRTTQITNDSTLSVQVSLDLNDAYKLAVGSKGSLPSPSITEVVSGRDSFRVHEGLRLLLSQISAARGLEYPWNDMSPSPRVQGQLDEFKFSDASSSAVLENITKRLSLDRNESGLESLDVSIVSEIEGESPVDRLRRQIELDRKSISILYKELEEERNASAIAANQTMAMITRLQEEKAAVQMEALQYQRMMEEQAEYDQEALQRSNELLSDREKEIQDLEAELESYRKQYGGGSQSHRMLEQAGDVEAREKCPISEALSKSAGYDKLKENEISQEPGWTGSGCMRSPLLDFEDEKRYISECLRRLEKKLHLFSNNGMYAGLARFDVEEDGLPAKDVTSINYEPKDSINCNCHYSEESAGVNDLASPYLNDDSSLLQEDTHAKTSSTLPSEDAKENHDENFMCSSCDVSSKDEDLAVLKDEISHLNERLATLEADRNFLEHAMNSLRNGNDGVQFIQEIACYLRELRRIGVSRREHILV